MKTTAERLREVYCRPMNEAEWDLLNVKNRLANNNPNNDIVCWDKFAYSTSLAYMESSVRFDFNKTQIPVQHFIDLIEDKIVAWRLVEDGFENKYGADYVYKIGVHTDLYVTPNYYFIRGRYNSDEVDISVNLKTYSDLLTLIRLL
jgi:hypothetical protein